MILEGLASFAMWIIELIFGGFQLVSLPLNLVSTLIDFMKYGAFVLGGDLLALVFACVFFWLTFKFTAGLLLFLYRLIPLT